MHVNLPAAPAELSYHYRLISTIALAEVARQVGVRAPDTRRQPRPPIYDRRLQLLLDEAGETVLLQELANY